ncbi:hypothetical protein sscle_04g036760 [Sclerotinia sclerotiorum 1980 UF-70]|uniref:Glycosyl transferase CAP10 domain-containing protein n=1 Tax=Sclerotinia sclerotiorum (strain ATCC 18683 / 1980 / Ss-1) TaxID=665079 RepID=A0A1D9Q1X2_SCLS1|nr:hypothetical protein sscle_04g036760 [Sclerotinia sclerotiorum 1980 UF-70]
MAYRSRSPTHIGIILLTVLVCVYLYNKQPTNLRSSIIQFSVDEQKPSVDILQSLSLTEDQCAANFPGLTKEIDDAVARGPFPLRKQPDHRTGLVQGRIKDGKVYIISTDPSLPRNMLQERDSVLHQLHRAVITSPSPLPNTIFAFNILDTPMNNSWAFSRSNDPHIENGNYWVMPHFSFWSWPLSFIGTVDQALSKIEDIEKNTQWTEKIDKAVWRGTGWFNTVGNKDLRPGLIQKGKEKEWADIEALKWNTNSESAENAIGIEDFCRYKYIVYTEGITYSGRLLFHQACASIILTPPPTYLLHNTHFMRPIFSSSFFSAREESPETGYDWATRWPKTYGQSEANIIFVEPDWSDLEETIMYLRKNPEIATGIAKRQRDLFTKYLSPASEACYWRALIRGWSKVAEPDYEDDGWAGWDAEGPENGEGMRWETFSLLGKVAKN